MIQAVSASPVYRTDIANRAVEIFRGNSVETHSRVDRLFAALMIIQWIGCIVAAVWISPLTWAGAQSEIHIHIWAATLLGGMISLFPVWLALFRPGTSLTRHVIAISQMLTSALLIHLTGGRIESHFHVFGSLAFLACYRDWKVLITATVVVAADHFIRGIFYPQSVFGVLSASPWRALEHAGWVLFEDIFLMITIRQSVQEMRLDARHQATLEKTNEIVEAEVAARTEELHQQAKVLRDAELKSRTLLDGSPVCIKIIDLESRLQYMSAAGVKQLKIDDIESFYGQTYPPEFYPEEMRAPLIEHLQQAMAGKVASVVSPVLDAEGGLLWYHTTFTPACDEGRIEYIIVSSVEITDQKRAEAELIASKDVAEAANRAKSEFLANMSHEIRTPMTAILGFTDILLENVTEPESIAAIHTVKENGEYLITLLNDILDLSKIEAKKVDIECVDCEPGAVLAGVASLMQVRAKAKGLPLEVRFDGPVPERIQSDPTRLSQVLINLVGNAIKFTETGSVAIVVKLLADPAGHSKLRFDIIDTGMGIPEESLSKVFEAFTQADGSTTRKFGGTGLGLSISRRLVELLGGEISVTSKVGQGSTFSITVATGSLEGVSMVDNPFEKAADAKEESKRKTEVLSKTPLENTRILVAEDGPDNQRLISFLLKKAGAKVTLVDNGQLGMERALEAVREGRPFDVILMDMQMPVLDGYQATAKLRQAGYDGPIIALTAHAMSTDRQKCLDAGCDEFTTKPINKFELISIVQNFIAVEDSDQQSDAEEMALSK